MHGPTFMGNRLACAVSNASIKLLLSQKWQERIQKIENHFRSTLSHLSKLDSVNDVRALGAIGVVEMANPVDMEFIQSELIKNGVWLRPFGKLIYSMPPYNMSDAELEQLTNGMVNTIEAYDKKLKEDQ